MIPRFFRGRMEGKVHVLGRLTREGKAGEELEEALMRSESIVRDPSLAPDGHRKID